jgi:hypothetical protein
MRRRRRRREVHEAGIEVEVAHGQCNAETDNHHHNVK